MEKITKRTRIIETVEYIIKCGKCGRIIIGSTENQVRYNLDAHKQGKDCIPKLSMAKGNYNKDKLKMSKEALGKKK